ncbi:golgi uridine diphosphate-N- acetylglucosamine transporter [Coemansia sp. RSA 2607]|nr:golgi uridine diphosphate-N- acetylglucosamine transporter [Coemansia sp. RSA 2607]KAJ2394760.1 golgi uridine diphosphate-N- acetylglucosamine transporter [Coemansia sp. RSA 2603]
MSNSSGGRDGRTKLVTAAAHILTGDWLAVLTLIFFGCCSNVFALESLVREVPKCGNLITFGQFVFITATGLPTHMQTVPGRFGWIPRLRPRKVPLFRWAVMVGLYFCVSVLNNLALGYDVSIPLHIVFRSAGLIANMVCGYVVMRKRYAVKQVVAVVMVSVGVVVATLASVGDRGQGSRDGRTANESVIGIAFLTVGVFLAAMLGLYQETTYRKYGKHWQEGLFYNHALALPMFLVFYRDIASQIQALSLSSPVRLTLGVRYLSFIDFSVPHLWVSLVLNVLSQLVCVSGVHRFTSMSSSLTLNVVLNVRKLVSLVLSVLLFKNAVTGGMVVGCGMVFVGTFAYTQSAASSGGSSSGAKTKEEPRERLDEGIAADTAKLQSTGISNQSEAIRRRRQTAK